MSGNSVLHDGRNVVEVYGTDLDKLEEGHRVGVMRTTQVSPRHFKNGLFCKNTSNFTQV